MLLWGPAETVQWSSVPHSPARVHLISLQGESPSTKTSSAGFESTDLVLEINCSCKCNVQKILCRDSRLLLQTKPASVIYKWNTAAHISLALNGSTKHSTPLDPPSFMTHCIPHFFASFSLLLPAKVSLSVCAPAAGLWSVPCVYPLVLIPALFFNYVSASTLLKCCQPFTVLPSRRKADP